MEQYTNVFDKSKIYNILFMKIFTVSEYGSLSEFQENKQDHYQMWVENYFDAEKNKNEEQQYLDGTVLSAEYGKLLGVTLCTVSMDDDGNLKRKFQNCFNKNENEVFDFIFTVLNEAGKNKDSLLCGHNIIGYDIPFLIKRGLSLQQQIPQILKKAINSKPWESLAIDTMNLWKFGGFGMMSLNEITTFLGLKYKELPTDELLLNLRYHQGAVIDVFQKETMNRVNLTIQLYNKLRTM